MKRQSFFDWAELPDSEYNARIGYLFVAMTIILGVPISLSSYSSMLLPQACLSALVGGAIPTLMFALRLRTGWGYISNRLVAKEVYYEMKQRGYLVKKDAESQMRDKLLNEYEVVPVLKRVDASASVLAAVLVACLVGVYIMGGALADGTSGSDLPAYCESRYFKAIAGGGACN